MYVPAGTTRPPLASTATEREQIVDVVCVKLQFVDVDGNGIHFASKEKEGENGEEEKKRKNNTSLCANED